MPVVYLARNLNNGKLYVGVTKYDIPRRRYQHFHAAKHGSPFLFARAIRKHGASAFEFSVIEKIDSYEEALRLEREWISELKPEYNTAAGGRGTNGVKWTADRRARVIPNLTASWTEKRRDHMKRLMKGRRPSDLAILRSIKKNKELARGVLCLERAELFRSAVYASSALGITTKHIQSVCSGEWISAKGLHFIYSDRPLSREECANEIGRIESRRTDWRRKVVASRSRPVVCMNDGQEFASGAAAAKHYGISQMRIVQLCQSGGETSAGLKFRYSDSAAVTKPEKTQEQIDRMLEGQRLGRKKANAARKKVVVCLDDGSEYPSLTEAAAGTGINLSSISAAIYRNGRAGGKRFAFAGAA